jgi:hypothetical protein
MPRTKADLDRAFAIQATEDRAAFFLRRRRLPRRILRLVSGPTTGAGPKAAAMNFGIAAASEAFSVERHQAWAKSQYSFRARL